MEHDTLDWWKGDAETTLRVDYPLTEDSLFVDVGGHAGNWTEIMVRRYNCRAWLFEPIPEFMAACRRKFEANPKVTLFQYALSDHRGTAPISIHGVDSSLFKFYDSQTDVPLVDAAEMLKDAKATLISINCEGSEFVILPRLIETGIVRNFDNIQVQFHELYPGAESKRQIIREKLKETHEESYCYRWVWESWKLKQS